MLPRIPHPIAHNGARASNGKGSDARASTQVAWLPPKDQVPRNAGWAEEAPGEAGGRGSARARGKATDVPIFGVQLVQAEVPLIVSTAREAATAMMAKRAQSFPIMLQIVEVCGGW